MSSQVPKPSTIAALLSSKLAEGPAQKREDEFYTPRIQSYWQHDGTSWKEAGPVSAGTQPAPALDPTAIRLLSWNIDILAGGIEIRMEAALRYLESLVSQAPPSIPLVIFLQEMGQSDLAQIREAAWVQSRFNITEYDERNWISPMYGTTTLVDKRLKIDKVFRVPWFSKFERDGLFVDIALQDQGGNGGAGKALRLCNTHLESLVADPPVRPLQLEAAARYLHDRHAQAALLAGDLNAIQPFDRTLHSENNLKDAYLELGGKEDSDDGYTWGYQVPQWMREKFGCSRMDKILYCGGIKVRDFERIGVDVKVAEDKVKEMRDAGEEEWVTDHYGVMGIFELDSGWQLGISEGGNVKPAKM